MNKRGKMHQVCNETCPRYQPMKKISFNLPVIFKSAIIVDVKENNVAMNELNNQLISISE